VAIAASAEEISKDRAATVSSAAGLSTEQWVKERLGGYIKLAVPDRREAVANLAAEGHSTREIGEILGVSKDTAARDVSNATPAPTKADRRAVRETELAAKQTALPDKRYGVIVADPEWRFEPWSRRSHEVLSDCDARKRLGQEVWAAMSTALGAATKARWPRPSVSYSTFRKARLVHPPACRDGGKA
jgi:hypothetical protein